MDFIIALISAFKSLHSEHITGLVALSAIGLVSFALYVVHTNTKDRK